MCFAEQQADSQKSKDGDKAEKSDSTRGIHKHIVYQLVASLTYRIIFNPTPLYRFIIIIIFK